MTAKLQQTSAERKPRIENYGTALKRAAKLTDLTSGPVGFQFGDWDITIWPGKIKLPPNF